MTDKSTTLFERAIDVIQERLDDLRNERQLYDGYTRRQARYDVLIAETETLIAELSAANAGENL